MEQSSCPRIFQNGEMKSSTFCQDSGFYEVLQISKVDTSETDYDTPNENVSQHRVTTLCSDAPKHQMKDSIIYKEKCLKENASCSSWCETPKISKKDSSLRRRLLMSKAATDGRTSCIKTPEKKHFMIPRPEEVYFGGVTDSPDMGLFEALATSTLKAEELTMSCRKRRLMFSQIKTSTLQDGNHSVSQSPVFKVHAEELLVGEDDLSESSIFSMPTLLTPNTQCDGDLLVPTDEHFQTPVNVLGANLADSLSVLSTPSFTPISKLDTSASEDSGFTSLDKSQDSLVDHDGSFQELLQQSASKCKEMLKLADLRRRTRLERQRRLPTLREGGSQSEEELRVVDSVPGQVKPLLMGQEVLNIEGDDELFLEKTPLGATPVKLEDFSLTPALQMVHVLCQRSARSLKAQPSLDELLRSPGDSPSLRTMSLTGLIGRKMGLEKMDILVELKIRNLRHILGKILKFLSSEDIYRFGQVTCVWDEIISQDKMAYRRRRAYLKDLKIALELGSAAHVPDAETRLNLHSRSALKSVQAQSKPLSGHTPVSGNGSTIHVKQTNSSSKRDKFIEVAKTLFHDECLRPCPRCQHPAKCNSVRREGVCSHEDCAYQFCTGCLCAYHGSKECASGSAKRRSKEVLPGSAQSRRNIKRL